MVGTLVLEVFLPNSLSLKAKRSVLNRIKGRVRSRFNASVGELDHQELWQRASLGIAVVGNEYGRVHDVLDKIFRMVDSEEGINIVGHSMEIV